jgi:methylthioribose-1-phosphate isomerase
MKRKEIEKELDYLMEKVLKKLWAISPTVANVKRVLIETLEEEEENNNLIFTHYVIDELKDWVEENLENYIEIGKSLEENLESIKEEMLWEIMVKL